MAVLNLGSDVEQLLADVNRPAVPEGTFLAVVESVGDKLNAETNSYSLVWNLLVNTTPYDPANPSGWDTEGRVVPLTWYTYVGKKVNGQLTDTAKAFSVANALSALGITTGVVDTDAVKYRQIVVVVKHEPSRNNPDQMWPTVKRALRYKVGEEVAPKLAHLADAVEDAPKGDSDPEF